MMDGPASTSQDAATGAGRRDALMALGIFAIALVIRVLHLRELAIHDPFYTIPSVDGLVYDAWAREIVAGDWLGEGVLFLGPLYPFFMAAIYGLFGAGLVPLKIVQALLGALSCALVFGLARECFGARVALVAGLAAALHTMLVFYGGTVMVVNLQVPLVVGAVWLLVRAFARPHALVFAAAGLAVGLSVLARQTMLLLVPLIGAAILLGFAGAGPLRDRLVHAIAFGAVVAALILPFTLRNFVVGDDLVLLNSTGGANFYMGNQPGSDGTWDVPDLGHRYRVDNPRAMREAFTAAAERETGRSLRPSEVSSYWLSRGIATIAEDPVRWVRLELRKAGLFVNAYEVWNNRSVEVSRRFSWVLRLPLVGAGLVMPLALVGLWRTRARFRSLLPIYGALLVYLASALLFFVLSRYRMPAMVLLLPFAAFVVVELWDGLRARDWRTLAISVGAIVALAIAVRVPLTSENRLHMAYYNLGNKFRELERWEEAIDAYHESLAANPRAISTFNNLAVALEGAGRDEEAIETWKRVGVMAMRRGDRRRMERAARHLRELGIAIPESPPGARDGESGTSK